MISFEYFWRLITAGLFLVPGGEHRSQPHKLEHHRQMKEMSSSKPGVKYHPQYSFTSKLSYSPQKFSFPNPKPLKKKPFSVFKIPHDDKKESFKGWGWGRESNPWDQDHKTIRTSARIPTVVIAVETELQEFIETIFQNDPSLKYVWPVSLQKPFHHTFPWPPVFPASRLGEASGVAWVAGMTIENPTLPENSPPTVSSKKLKEASQENKKTTPLGEETRHEPSFFNSHDSAKEINTPENHSNVVDNANLSLPQNVPLSRPPVTSSEEISQENEKQFNLEDNDSIPPPPPPPPPPPSTDSKEKPFKRKDIKENPTKIPQQPQLMADLEKTLKRRATRQTQVQPRAAPQEDKGQTQEDLWAQLEKVRSEASRGANENAPKKPLWYKGKYIQPEHPEYPLALEKQLNNSLPLTKKTKTSHKKSELSAKALQVRMKCASQAKKWDGKSMSEILRDLSKTKLRKAKENTQLDHKVESDDPQDKLLQELSKVLSKGNFLKKTKPKSPPHKQKSPPHNFHVSLKKRESFGTSARSLFGEENSQKGSLPGAGASLKEEPVILQAIPQSKLNSTPQANIVRTQQIPLQSKKSSKPKENKSAHRDKENQDPNLKRNNAKKPLGKAPREIEDSRHKNQMNI